MGVKAGETQVNVDVPTVFAKEWRETVKDFVGTKKEHGAAALLAYLRMGKKEREAALSRWERDRPKYVRRSAALLAEKKE